MKSWFPVLLVSLVSTLLVACGNENKQSSNVVKERFSFSDVKDAKFEVSLTPKNLQNINVQLSALQALATENVFEFGDISFEQVGQTWLIKNRTPQGVSSLAIRYGDNKTLATLELDQALPAYTQGTLSFSTHTLTKLVFEDQLILFHPKVQIAGFNADCSDKTKTCYGDPDANQREIYEVNLINMHNAFNHVSFNDYLEQYFLDADNCKNYSACSNYTDLLLNYGVKNILAMGLEGHQLGMKVMRNVYAAEGMGGGSSPNIEQVTASSGGWASYWESYIDSTSTSYRPFSAATYNTVFHEVGHAYGFSHDSGMTYGFADAWGGTYVQQYLTQIERERRNQLELPEVLVDSTTVAKGQLRLSLYRPYTKPTSDKVKFRFISAQPLNIVASVPTGNAVESLDVTFQTIPKVPVYIRTVTSEGKYLSTLKLKGSDIVKSTSYLVDGKKFTILDDELLNTQANGWAIRSLCDQPNQTLATKNEYQKLWDYMKSNALLETLKHKYFLSSDEPSGYVIWLMGFESEQMTSSWYGMTNAMGEDKGLVCVAPMS